MDGPSSPLTAVVFDWGAAALSVLTVAAAFSVGRSLCSVAEFTALAVSAAAVLLSSDALPRPGISSLLLLKLLWSFGVFATQFACDPKKRGKPFLVYGIGFNSDTLHAALGVGQRFIHYVHARHDDADADSVWKLAPVIVERPLPSTLIKGPVGVAAIEVEEAHLGVLPISGRCHDWACLAAHTLSDDKFMSYALTTWGRWLTWFVAAFWLAAALLTGLNFDLTRRAVNCAYAAVALVDVCNMRKAQLRAAAQAKGTWRAALDVALSAVVCALFLWPSLHPVWLRTMLPFEFPLLVATSCLLTAALYCWMNIHAPPARVA